MAAGCVPSCGRKFVPLPPRRAARPILSPQLTSVIEPKVSLAQRRHWYALSIAHLFHALNAFMAALRLSFGRAEGLRTHNLRPLFHATYKLRICTAQACFRRQECLTSPPFSSHGEHASSSRREAQKIRFCGRWAVFPLNVNLHNNNNICINGFVRPCNMQVPPLKSIVHM